MKRREFTGSVMVAALAPLLGAAAAPLPAGWWEAAVRDIPGARLPGADLDAHARALAGVIRAQYGSRLREADLAEITRQIRSALERAEQMRRVELANGDEPDFVFMAPAEPPR